MGKCEYRGYERLLTEQFIGGLNDEGMTDEILRDVAMLGNIEEATSEHVLTWACRVEGQRAQRSVLTASRKIQTLMPSS